MTDREKLLVVMLGDVPARRRGVTTLELVALLADLGAGARRAARPAVHDTAPPPAA